jgi:hypothetical protein
MQTNPHARNNTPPNDMLWLIVFLLWSFWTAIYGYAPARPAMSVMLAMLALLGFLQVIVSLIDAIQYIKSRWVVS